MKLSILVINRLTYSTDAINPKSEELKIASKIKYKNRRKAKQNY
jgi:hypothetical protein